jgi:predicted ester cyclase
MTSLQRTDDQQHNVDTFATVIRAGFNEGNLEALDGLFTSDFVEHQRGFPTPDLAGLKRGIAGLRRSIPDIHLEIVDTVVEGDTICFVLRGDGTHDGPLGPLPASGTHLTIDVIDVCRFREGKIAEHWGVPDRMGIMEQIGMPQPPKWLMGFLLKMKRVRQGR